MRLCMCVDYAVTLCSGPIDMSLAVITLFFNVSQFFTDCYSVEEPSGQILFLILS